MCRMAHLPFWLSVFHDRHEKLPKVRLVWIAAGRSATFLGLNKILHAEQIFIPSVAKRYHHGQSELAQLGAVGSKTDHDATRL